MDEQGGAGENHSVVRRVESSDLSTLRAQLVATGRNVEIHSKRLRDAYPAYQQSLGRQSAAVLKEIGALAGAVEHAITAVQHTHVTSGAGRNAQRLVLDALRTLHRGLADLHRAYAAGNEEAAKRALTQAQTSAKECEHLRARASRALGFSWRL